MEILTTRNDDIRKAGFRLQTAMVSRGVTASPCYSDVQRDYDMQYRRFSVSAGPEGKNIYNTKLISRLDKTGKQNINKQVPSAHLFIAK